MDVESTTSRPEPLSERLRRELVAAAGRRRRRRARRTGEVAQELSLEGHRP